MLGLDISLLLCRRSPAAPLSSWHAFVAWLYLQCVFGDTGLRFRCSAGTVFLHILESVVMLGDVEVAPFYQIVTVGGHMALAVRYIWACLLVVPLYNVNTWRCYRNKIIKPIFFSFYLSCKNLY